MIVEDHQVVSMQVRGLNGMLQRVDSFKGEFDFLSNFHESEFTFEGILYKNAESAFQAQKCESVLDKFQFSNLTASRAKKLGRRVKLRKDWENVKDDIMLKVVREKFRQNKDLARKLLETGTAYLEEGNTWNDKYWGTCNGEGLNKLGHILMVVRKELQMK